ncbi:hypothetical protein IID23_04615 [Patescibacteria group bacterium]|nr:hypothetical protein [Patescibacteria group bacterium]
MDLKLFANQFVEGYLFKDLENMSNFKIKETEIYGNLGYPMISTVISGMELLGTILYPKPLPIEYGRLRDKTSNDCYKYFWRYYFLRNNPQYKEIKNLGRIIRELLRNGIDHHFIGHFGLTVTKEGHHKNLKPSSDGQINLDAMGFYFDFHGTYNKLVKNIFINPNTDKEKLINRRSTKRLEEFIKAKEWWYLKFEGDIKRYIKKYNRKFNLNPNKIFSSREGLISGATVSISSPTKITPPSGINLQDYTRLPDELLNKRK